MNLSSETSDSPQMGQQIGHLTYVAEDAPRYNGQRQALLVCDCGKPVFRTLAYLKNLPAGRKPVCRQCLSTWRSGSYEERLAFRRAYWLYAWENGRSLYTLAWEDQELVALRETIDCPVEYEQPELPVAEWVSDVVEIQNVGHERHIELLSNAEGLVCARCDEDFFDGFCCLQCEEALCPKCKEMHTKAGVLTLDEVGRLMERQYGAMGWARESVRRIEAQAIGRLRHRLYSGTSRTVANLRLADFCSWDRDPTPRFFAPAVVEKKEPVLDTPYGACCRRAMQLSDSRRFVYCTCCGNTRSLFNRDWTYEEVQKQIRAINEFEAERQHEAAQ